ncbi:MAG: hypothetical protein JW984_03250 [Deltaproteobacteria bacterium]|uniref:Uncharacterized protein n=1 Tax=Candidatus Zymogenus saltonus TaxID=2844893 RepID=A0A9D8KAU7_9DELT|nr:hypothetical protein [Candidatus Zymogenus saltonus]
MATKHEGDLEEPKGGEKKRAAEKSAKPKKAEAKKPKKGEKQPYSGTHGYTEEEVEGMVGGKKGGKDK